MAALFGLLLAALLATAVAQSSGLDAALRQRVLDAHNMARQEVDAANMAELRWSSTVEQSAASWAANCQFAHASGTGYGENLGMTSRKDIAAAVDASLSMWKAEKTQWSYGQTWSSGTGHYTQMIWAKTLEIGCAANICSFGTLVVCRYSPPGNYIGQNPYVRGPSCSQCPSNRPGCNNGLCV